MRRKRGEWERVVLERRNGRRDDSGEKIRDFECEEQEWIEDERRGEDERGVIYRGE
jgi:hypothetical protein